MKSEPEIEFIARGLMQIGSEILLCRNKKKGYAYLPGGHVEPGESAAEACVREFLEETAMPITVVSPLLICEARFEQSGRPRHEFNVVFHVEHVQNAALGSDGVKQAAVSQEAKIEFIWADLASVPDLDLRPDPIKAWLVSGGETRSENHVQWISSREPPA